MSFNVAFHLTTYLVTGVHVIAGMLVGGVYLRILLKAPKGKRVALHARHVVPAAFGWAAVIFAAGYHVLRRLDFARPVLWTDVLLLAGLLSMAFAIAVLAREGSLQKAVE